jgi:hypothetical protein
MLNLLCLQAGMYRQAAVALEEVLSMGVLAALLFKHNEFQ